ncbi:Two component regulator propeller [Polystyrenella longa]|uniref:Two component regulator propeller n=1 Tax=Polystyrenella longa TaxID=2528007 RepID=A0A518CNH8_9PLAN|nr:hypothetical protein [Polystyrenella longa]QDU80773.1 Two component regulator propeller [Polystyrenella longa]
MNTNRFFQTLGYYCGVFICFLTSGSWHLEAKTPVQVGEFTQQYHIPYDEADGLPDQAITQLHTGKKDQLYARAESGGLYQLEGEEWKSIANASIDESLFTALPWYRSLSSMVESQNSVRDVAENGKEIVVAAAEGLIIGDGTHWSLVLPQEGNVRWAPVDVRAVAYDPEGRLWFAAPQGVGCRHEDGTWQLFTGADGLPFNDFTCMSTGSSGVWFGTTNGAIQYDGGHWHFRQGGRWLLANHVHDIAIDAQGKAWIATDEGVSCITAKPMTLTDKATFYEQEIEKYNRRTKYGYVNPARLSSPGDKSTAKPTYSDNDGFNTGLYLAAVSYGYAVTEDPKLKEYAHKAFRALSFLSEVTQGGDHAAPKGFVARNVIPISEPDPNVVRYDLEYDLRRNERDKLWKVMQPRMPIDKTGQWYWKCDSSSDELDGHFFGYSVYYDLVCETEQQKEQVRQVVRNIIDHVIEHNYAMVDYDGTPTRWGHFAPEDLNQNPAWKAERGINSYCILGYLSAAHHITEDPKYRTEYLKLAIDHGYGMNGMSQYKWNRGAYSQGHQPGDNMMFMNYYHLLRYETDPQLLSMYQFAISRHWTYEKYERNAFTNFIYAACCDGKTRKDNWGEIDLSPPVECYTDAIDSLKRYPLDLVEWPMSNAHRIDMRPLEGQSRESATIGTDNSGYLFPIDERHEIYWDWDPWKLTGNSKGATLRPGFHYLLAYYMGRYHGYIDE